MTATESIEGKKNTVRKNTVPIRSPERKQAKIRANGISTSNFPIEKTKVLPTDCQNLSPEGLKIFKKFSNPIHLGANIPLYL